MRRPALRSCFALGVLGLASAAVGEAPPTAPATYPLQEGFVDAHGALVYYKTLGRGQPLLILHGGPGASHDSFLPPPLPLARRQPTRLHLQRRSRRSASA